MSSQRYCTFLLDEYQFGIEVDKIQEAIRHQDMTTVPLAHSVITGLINLRGHIVTAMGLRKRLGMPNRSEDAPLPMNIVIQDGESPVSFVVDKIGDVMEVEDLLFEAPPPTLDETTRKLVKGAYKVKDYLLLILNTEEALTLPNLETASTTESF
jgi:purine-binding chemotaxis protein CheW